MAAHTPETGASLLYRDKAEVWRPSLLETEEEDHGSLLILHHFQNCFLVPAATSHDSSSYQLVPNTGITESLLQHQHELILSPLCVKCLFGSRTSSPIRGGGGEQARHVGVTARDRRSHVCQPAARAALTLLNLCPSAGRPVVVPGDKNFHLHQTICV